MKFLKYLAAFAVASLTLSCQTDDKTQALPADAIAGPVLNDHSDVLVDENTLANEVTFSWSAVDYGYQAAISYSLYAVYGDSEPYQLGESNNTSYTLTKEMLNNALVAKAGLGIPEDKKSDILLYVESSISSGREKSYVKRSNVISLAVTTIKSTSAPWIRRPLYVAGNYQGWAPDKAPVLWETAENSDIYEGLVYLGNAANTPNYIDDDLCHFKLCPNPSWAGNLGGSLDALTNEGDPGHLLAEDGLYWVSVTLNAEHSTGTVKLKKISMIGVIGAAIGGWSEADDKQMSLVGLPTDILAANYADQYYAAMNTQTWEVVVDNCVGGEFKYRLEQKWDQGWGENLAHLKYNGGNCTTDLTGKVRFTINFRGDIPALSEDTANPSPISGTVTQVE